MIDKGEASLKWEDWRGLKKLAAITGKQFKTVGRQRRRPIRLIAEPAWRRGIRRYILFDLLEQEAFMHAAKQDVETLLQKLPDDCALEDIQYHLYVIEKLRNSMARAESEGTITQEDVEARLSKWVLA